jgi:hypothetical protein
MMSDKKAIRAETIRHKLDELYAVAGAFDSDAIDEVRRERSKYKASVYREMIAALEFLLENDQLTSESIFDKPDLSKAAKGRIVRLDNEL